ncbi:MAG: hypothetical protein K9J79_05115 [Desulfobacteraceae bacterium]|nr:hypothetical protein [Desulfobacteraceae bacterium]
MSNPSAAFFPFTFISGHTARACSARFGPVVLYQPAKGAVPEAMTALEKQGEIILRYPVTGDDRRLAHLAREFQDWGGMHEKSSAAVKKFAENGFYNQEFAPEISTEILKGPREPDQDPGPVFNARLFLLLAQEYDRQTAELEAELSLTDNAARDLFSGIKGGMEDHPGFSPGFDESARAPDPGGYMTEPRLRAWHYLMAADPEPASLLVTSSPAVIGAMQERFETMSALERLPEDIELYSPKQGEPEDGYAVKIYKIRECSCFVCLLTCFEENLKK